MTKNSRPTYLIMGRGIEKKEKKGKIGEKIVFMNHDQLQAKIYDIEGSDGQCASAPSTKHTDCMEKHNLFPP